jgi:hypothetical protein
MWGNLPPDLRAIHALPGVYGRVTVSTDVRQKGTPKQGALSAFRFPKSAATIIRAWQESKKKYTKESTLTYTGVVKAA